MRTATLTHNSPARTSDYVAGDGLRLVTNCIHIRVSKFDEMLVLRGIGVLAMVDEVNQLLYRYPLLAGAEPIQPGIDLSVA